MHKKYLATIREFVTSEVIPQFNEGHYQVALVSRMKELGLFGITIPKRFGGLNLSPVEVCELVSELSYGSTSLMALLGSHLKVCQYIRDFGTTQQQWHLLPLAAKGEIVFAHGLTEDTGKSTRGLQTRIIKEGQDLYLKGHKTYVTNGLHADQVCVVAEYENHLALALVSPHSQNVGLGEDYERLGFKGISLCRITFNKCHVREQEIIGGSSFGAEEALGSVKMYALLNYSSRSIGLLRAIVQNTRSFLETKKSRSDLASKRKAYTKLERMLTMSEKNFSRLLQLVETEKVKLHHAYKAKLELSEIAVKASLEALSLHGGAGYLRRFRVERYLRDAIALTIIGTPSNRIRSILDCL